MSSEDATNSSDTRREVLDFLKDLQTHYGTYHNHKENSAWAGVVFFAALLAASATVVRDHLPNLLCSHRIAAVLAVLALCVVVYIFMREQFKLRRRAAEIVAASFKSRCEIVSNPSQPIRLTDWAVEAPAADDAMLSTHFLPKRIGVLMSDLSLRGQGTRKTLEECAYLLLFGLTIGVVLLLWLSS